MTTPTSTIIVEAIRPRHVLLENRSYMRIAATGTLQSLNAKLRHLRTGLTEAEAAEQAAEQAADGLEARRAALRAERTVLAEQIETDDRALAQGDITIDEAASRQGRLATIDRVITSIPSIIRERTDAAHDARSLARSRRDDVQALEAGMALATIAKGLSAVTPAICEYLNYTRDAALVIRLADLAPDVPDEPENSPTSPDDEGGEYVPAE